MNTNEPNQIVDEAKANKKVVMNFETKFRTTGGIANETEQLLSLAYENEGDIEYTANRLETNLRGGIERLQGALHYLRLNKSGCLCSNDVLQALNHNIDTDIILLQRLEKNRQYYRQYIKE